MTNLIQAQPADQAAGERFSEWADPGWRQRRDDAVGMVCTALLLGAGCGLLVGWLGWAGGLLAAGLYLAWLRLMIATLGGGSR
jgi:hypothetical protein